MTIDSKNTATNLELRSLSMDDASSLTDLVLYDQDHLRQYGDNTGDVFTDVDRTRAIIQRLPEMKRYGYGIWTVDELVGSAMVACDPTMRTGELGVWIGKEHTGRGHAGAAIQELTRICLSEIGLERVQMRIDARNKPSLRMAEKIDAKYISTTNENGYNFHIYDV